jgi:hypothetical protein
VLRPRIDASIPDAIAARFWLACAEWGGVLAPKDAADDARRAIALYTALGDRFGTFRSWKALAYVHSSAGRHDEALEALRQAIELRDATWPKWILALFDNTAGIVCSQAGDLARARRHYTAFLEVCGRIGPGDELNATALLVDLDVAEGLVQKAGEQAAAMIARPEAMTLRWSDGRGLRTYATALMVAGRLDDAERSIANRSASFATTTETGRPPCSTLPPGSRARSGSKTPLAFSPMPKPCTRARAARRASWPASCATACTPSSRSVSQQTCSHACTRKDAASATARPAS